MKQNQITPSTVAERIACRLTYSDVTNHKKIWRVASGGGSQVVAPGDVRRAWSGWPPDMKTMCNLYNVRKYLVPRRDRIIIHTLSKTYDAEGHTHLLEL